MKKPPPLEKGGADTAKFLAAAGRVGPPPGPPVALTSLVPVASGYRARQGLTYYINVALIPLACLPKKGGTLKRL